MNPNLLPFLIALLLALASVSSTAATQFTGKSDQRLQLPAATKVGGQTRGKADARRADPPKGAERLTQMSAEAEFFYSRLPLEAEIPSLHELAQRFRVLPKEDQFIITQRPGGPPVRVAVHQRGCGVRNRVLVFIHGVLSSYETWSHVAGALADDYDSWLIDLPGCGASDKPDAEALGPGGYSPSALADHVLQALARCVAACPEPPRLTIVAHSLGGMVALRAFGDGELAQRHQSTLAQVDGLVLLAPADVLINQEIPAFMQVINLPGWKVRIGQALGVVQEVLAASELDNRAYPSNATRESVDRMIAVLTAGPTRRAAQAMLRQAVPWFEKKHLPNWPAMLELEAGYARVFVPCQIVWGRRDQTLTVGMGYKLVEQLPAARLAVLNDCMHSPHLECPAEVAQIIRAFDRQLAAGGLTPDPNDSGGTKVLTPRRVVEGQAREVAGAFALEADLAARPIALSPVAASQASP